MKNPLRILQIIVQNKMRSGGAIQMHLLSMELSRRGHHVCAVYNENGKAAEDFTVFDDTGIDLRFVKMGRLKPNGESLKTVMALRRLILDQGFDLIHAHKGNAVDLVVCATLGLNVPIIANNGMSTPLNFFQSLKYRSRKIKSIIAVSRAVKTVMVKTGYLNPEKIRVIYGGVDMETFNPALSSSLRNELSLGAGPAIMGYVGSALPRKGIEFLLRAFAGLSRRFDVVLALAGVNESDLAGNPLYVSRRERIFPLGFRTDVPNCMAAFDVFVFPGIRDEGLTGTVREAAAMGLPIVTTDVAGNAELISDGYNGLVVPSGDAERLTAAVGFLLENRELAGLYGRRAREFVEKNMSTGVRVDAVEKLYYRSVGGT